MKPSSLTTCPVPSEQQPLHEYEELKASWLFNWASLTLFNYLNKITWVGLWSSLIVAPIAAASYSPGKHPWLFAISTSVGISALIFLLFLRIYLGWFYIKNRLDSEQVVYEESGWYDGQIWAKPPEMLNRDRLIVTYQIKPILQRLQITLVTISSIIVVGTLICFWIS